MPAAAPGTETLSLTRADGTGVAVTLHYDPDTRAWADPAVTVEGTGGAVLVLHGDETAVWLGTAAAVPIAAAVLAAAGMADRTNADSIALLAAVPIGGPRTPAILLTNADTA